MVSVSTINPDDENDGHKTVIDGEPAHDVTYDVPPENIPNDDESVNEPLFSDEELTTQHEDENELDQLVDRFVNHDHFNGFLSQEVSRIIDVCIQQMNDHISALHSSFVTLQDSFDQHDSFYSPNPRDLSRRSAETSTIDAITQAINASHPERKTLMAKLLDDADQCKLKILRHVHNPIHRRRNFNSWFDDLNLVLSCYKDTENLTKHRIEA